MIGDMINMAAAGDFKAAIRVIGVNFLLVLRRRIFVRKHRGVVNHDSSRYDRVEE